MSIQDKVAEIEKKYGKGSFYKMGDGTGLLNVEFVPTGIPTIDRILGGGIPKGRIVEFYGWESSSKTTLCQHIVAEFQKFGNCAFIDMEHALDPDYAERCGMNMEELYFAQPETGEEALDIVDMLIGEFDLIIVDSVASLLPRTEDEGDIGDAHMGLQARLMSQAMRKISPKLKNEKNDKKTTIIFTNQQRKTIGGFGGNGNTTSGGNALKFYSSIRGEVSRIGNIKKGETIVGSNFRLHTKKNKVYPPFMKAEYTIWFDGHKTKGIDKYDSLVRLAVEYKIVNKKGAWFKYIEKETGEVLLTGQGQKKFSLELESNVEIYNRLYKETMEHLNETDN